MFTIENGKMTASNKYENTPTLVVVFVVVCTVIALVVFVTLYVP